MHATPTSEQLELARAESSWLRVHDPLEQVRASLDSSPVTIDTRAVTHASESGLLALLTPDGGGVHADLAVVSEAHARAASSLPIADIAIAQWLIGAARERTGEDVAPNEHLVSVAVERTDGSAPLPMASDMQTVVLVGRDDAGDLIRVLHEPRLRTLSTLDLTRSWARTHAHAGDVVTIQMPQGTTNFVSDALALHRAWDALGGAATLLDMTVTYAGQRKQFGAAIGSFQAVKHHCANMTVAVEAARAALWSASLAIDECADPAARTRSVAAAVAFAKSAASDVASTALQVHGGIGFTWEHDLHLFLRRIRVDRAMNGTVESHRAALIPK
ncbi:acyl-CoA dehydrogenase family protein [Mycobacterium sp. E1747]|uniref:acyl-CoA dehydrogenase family protein n=1 Tax=Mycobacterium sp. E1747 TaxID=1834128 RepID=UPI0008009104|nr:acyl-CoA dehydrogenase family protein [Mycobacterium sp. E1747]OBH12786.1 acyl-CoA dehydrogenase [Mycobacterium sp. E1747]